MKPIYLLADSALLFKKNKDNEYCLQTIRQEIDTEKPKAVYIGASNGDAPEFFEIFQTGMQHIGIENCVHIKSEFTKEQQEALQSADLILLAGGDPQKGWEIMQDKGMLEIIRQKYLDGTVLIGVSAGAIQLTWELVLDDKYPQTPMLQFVPFLIDVHDELNDWKRLKLTLQSSSSMKRALGICRTSGLIYHEDQTIEVLGKPAYEFVYKDGGFTESLLWEGEGD